MLIGDICVLQKNELHLKTFALKQWVLATFVTECFAILEKYYTLRLQVSI